MDYEQRIYNPERMRKYRLDRAQAMLKKYGLGSCIVYSYDNHRYLGYYSTHQYARRRPGTFLLLIKDAGYPYIPVETRPPTGDTELMPWFKDKAKLVTSRQSTIYEGHPEKPEYLLGGWTKTAEEIKRYLKLHSVDDLPCGVDMTGVDMIDACRKAGIDMVNGNPAMAEARMIKNEDEIECCRTAGSIVESAHWEVCKALRPGVTEWQMAGVAAKALFDLGAEELEGPSFVVCSGYRSGHNVPAMPTDRVIRPGEMFIIDINGVSFQGYRSCFYRTYCVGDKPTEYQKELYQVAYDVQSSMERNIKPGITNEDWAKAVTKETSAPPTWPKPGKYAAELCHQLGLCSGDPGPRLSVLARFTEGVPPFTIRKGMVFAIEVGCYEWDGKKWAYDGAKIENVGAVTDTGCEVLYRFPYKDLITVGLPGVY